MRKSNSHVATVVASLVAATLLSVQVRAQQEVKLELPAQSLADSLRALGFASNTNIIFDPGLVDGIEAPALSLTATTTREALVRLLAGTQLRFRFVDDKTVSLMPPSRGGQSKTGAALPGDSDSVRLAQAETTSGSQVSGGGGGPEDSAHREADSPGEPDAKGIPEVLVKGTRSLNMDIRRTEDDPQPYVVFGREDLERSGAVSLDQFFQQRLTMSSGIINFRDSGGGATNVSLRGLGSGQTVILVDGRRLTGPSLYGTSGQADVSGIPLAAIERVEILPTTASGIYGGSATGGVINIVLRRDFTGAEAKVTYENTFASNTPSGQVDLSFGHHFNEGRTSLIFGAHYSDATRLYTKDRYRQLIRRTREGIMEGYPDFFLTPAGQPPLSNRPNIASSDGSELVLDDGTRLGSSFTAVPQGYQGVGSDGGAALAGQAGTYNWDLSDTTSVHARGSGGRQSLNGPAETKSGMMSLRHEFSEGLQGFLDLSVSERAQTFWTTDNGVVSFLLPADAPNNPFAQDIRVVTPVSEDGGSLSRIKNSRSALGLIKSLGRNWQISTDFSWSHASRSSIGAPRYDASSFNADVSSGSIDVLRDTGELPIDMTPYAGAPNGRTPFGSAMKDFSIRLAGPVYSLPAGAAMFSAALGYRNENLDDGYDINYTWGSYYYPDRSQKVKSAYMELLLPLFSAENARPGLRELDLQLSVRADDYTSNSGSSVFVGNYAPGQETPAGVVRGSQAFSSVDPTVALRWSPVQDLTVRFSYGTGFLPPNLNQVVTAENPGQIGPWYTDPLRGGTQAGDNPEGPFMLRSGGSSTLKPEESESWSAGFIFTPRLLPGARLSVDYTRIKKSGAILRYPGGIQGLIDDEASFPDRVVRGPKLPGDPVDWAGPIILIDNTLMNVAESWLEAWDVRLDARKDTERHGAIDLMLLGTWQPHYVTRALSSLPEVEKAGVGAFSPLKFRGTAGVVWSKEAWRAAWNVNYYHSYRVDPYNAPLMIGIQGDDVVSKQIYHDVFVSYDFGSAGGGVHGLLEKTEIQLGIRNLFNKAPPLDVDSLYIGMFSPFGDPRMATYTLSIKKAF